jgi:hypothetical protein
VSEDNTVGERLARIETQLELLIKRFDPALTALENRVARLERWVWIAVGTAVASGLTTVSNFVP